MGDVIDLIPKKANYVRIYTKYITELPDANFYIGFEKVRDGKMTVVYADLTRENMDSLIKNLQDMIDQDDARKL